MATTELIVLRLIHVLGGMAWVGFAAYNAFFLIPAFAEAGPAAGAVMGGLQKRKLFVILPILATLVIVSGLRLLMILSGNFSASFFATRMGLTFTVGGAIATLAFVFGLLHTRPTMEKVATLMAERAKAAPERAAALEPEIARLRSSGARSSTAVTAAIILAAAMMSVARYL